MGDSEVQETCHETIPSPHIAGGSVLGVHGLKMKKFSFIWKSPLIPKHLGALYILGKLLKWREKGFRSPCTTVLLLRRPPGYIFSPQSHSSAHWLRSLSPAPSTDHQLLKPLAPSSSAELPQLFHLMLSFHVIFVT